MITDATNNKEHKQITKKTEEITNCNKDNLRKITRNWLWGVDFKDTKDHYIHNTVD